MLIRKALKKRPGKLVTPWLSSIVEDPKVAGDLNVYFPVSVKKTFGRKSLCVVCKGSKFLCGKTRCPLLVRITHYLRVAPLIRNAELEGASPPAVFIGRVGYPYVYAGPLAPPIKEDTTIFDIPEFWFGKRIDEIVRFRSMLVRGMQRVHVKKLEDAGRILDRTIELALSSTYVDVELKFKKTPIKRIFLNDEVQPFGPSAVIREIDLGNPKWDKKIEKAYYDSDLKAAEAVVKLYEEGVLVSKIQRAFSVGGFGLESQRRLVPTRWSITAVDSIISNELIRKIKKHPEISEYRVYESTYLDNRFEVLMVPSKWSYEAMEAWYPGTIWNPNDRVTVILSDWEEYSGRTTYARIGGCYYSARLAVAEKLNSERRQATAIILREVRPGYIIPVGVWQVRENVRNALRNKPVKFNSLFEALNWIGGRLRIPLEKWIEYSTLLKNLIYQRRISDFLKA